MKTKYLFIVSLFALLTYHAQALTKTFTQTATGSYPWAGNWGGADPVTNQDDIIINPASGATITITGVPAIALNSLLIGDVGTGPGTVILTASSGITVTINNSAAANDLYLNNSSLTQGTNVQLNLAASAVFVINASR